MNHSLDVVGGIRGLQADDLMYAFQQQQSRTLYINCFHQLYYTLLFLNKR